MHPLIDSQLISSSEGVVVHTQYSYGNKIERFKHVFDCFKKAQEHDLCFRFELLIAYTEKLGRIITYYSCTSSIDNFWLSREILEHRNNYWDFLRAIRERTDEIIDMKGVITKGCNEQWAENMMKLRPHLDWYLAYSSKMFIELQLFKGFPVSEKDAERLSA